ncbi:MAG: hypothetical protein J1F31_02725 [Erysipelotrichales bacterium]|nr:hypothetical protein [Erysipelotrichales bacterium]
MNVINLLTLPNFDPSIISTISNIALVVIIVLILLGGLIGLLRGVWNESFRLIFIGILVILAYALTGRIGDWIAGIDLTKIIGVQTIENINGISVNVTSIKGTLMEVFAALGTGPDGSIQKTLSDPRTVQLITELALIVIRFVTFIILAIGIITIGNLLATLLYHLIFKHLITKKLRKEVKLRFVGFVEGMVKSGLVLSMLIVPFSSILNSISKAIHNADAVKKENLDNETYNQLLSWVEAYNDSALAKVLFNWTKDSDGNTLDMKLANIITSTSKSTMTFTDELSSFMSLGATLLSSGAINFADDDTIIIDSAILMNSEIVSVLIAQLTTSNLVLQALPIVADFALNIEGVSEYIDSEKINLDGIDWKKDLETLSSIYSDIYSEGIVDEEFLSNPAVMLKKIFNTKDETVHEKLVGTFEKFDEVGILNQVLPSLVWTMANTEGNALGDYLPTDWEKYQNIKFGSEFAIVYDSVYRINKTADNAIVNYLDAVLIKDENNKNLKALKYENDVAEQDNHELNDLLDAILSNSKDIIPIFVGERNAETNDFVNVNDEGKLQEGRCLLDSDLLVNSFGKLSSSIVNLIIGQMEGINVDSTKIDNAVKILDEEGRMGYKLEFATMLDIVAEIVSNESTKDLLTSNETINLNEEVCEALKTPLGKIDNSRILSAAIPEIVKGVINNNSQSLEEFGISPDSIYYDVDSLGNELVNILDFTPSLFNIINAIGENGDIANNFENIETKDLTKVLHGIMNSEMFNHKFDDKKRNFLVAIDTLFENLGYKDENITDNQSLINLTDAQWHVEINNIGTFFDTFKECQFTKLLDNPNGYLDPEILDPDSVGSLFNSIGDSKLLSVGLGPILDSRLGDLLSSIPNADLSFRNIVDWHAEGEHFRDLLDSAQQLNKNGVSLDNIDFINSDATDEEGNLLVRNLAVALSKSQLFADEYGFGNFLKDQLMDIQDLNFHDIDDPEKVTKTTQFFNEVSEKKDWESELDIVFNFIKALQAIGADGKEGQKGNAGLNKVLDKPQDYKELFIAQDETIYGINNFMGLNNSNALRMVIANAVNDASKNIEFGDIELYVAERIHVQQLVDMDKSSDRNIEINTICDALEKIQELDGLDFKEVRSDKTKLDCLKDAILLLHDSKMFNTRKIGADATVFEGIIAEFLNTIIEEDAIIGRLNDSMELAYNSSLEVVQSIANNECQEDLEDGWIDSDSHKGEISRIFDIINYADGVDFDDIGSDTSWLETNRNIDDILRNLNDSNLLYRTIPYFINDFINNKDTNSFSSDFSLKAAKPGFSYNAFTHEFDHYDDSEISRLVTILENFSTLEDVMKEDFSLNSIKKDNKEEKIKDTLKALANSDVFHVQGSNEEGKDTVYIQVICLSFDESTLSDTIYDVTLYQDKYTENGISSASENARNKILAFDEETKANNKTWNDEIDKVFDIYDQIIDLDDSEIELISDINVKRMTPKQITKTLKTINNSDLCYDAVPIYIKKAFNNISLSNFSENKEEYLIGRQNYGHDNTQSYELDVIENLLNGIAKYEITSEGECVYERKDNGDIKYAIEFNSKFKLSEFKNNNKSLEVLVQFLVDSKIFEDCRGLVLKNAIKSVGFDEYVSTRYDGIYEHHKGESLEHSNVFDLIFDKIEETFEKDSTRKQIKVEGSTLDAITDTLVSLIDESKNGSNTFTNLNSKDINKIFKHCYIYKYGEYGAENIQSLISCEIVSGFLAKNIKDSNYLDDYYLVNHVNEYSTLWYPSDVENFVYPIFNDLEAEALSASIESINTISRIGNNPANITSETVAQIKGLLGSLYDEKTKENSIIASLIYRKGIYDLLMGQSGVFYVANNVLSNNEAFANAYNDMRNNCANPFENDNFRFENVHNNIGIMFDEIISYYSSVSNN